MSIAIIFNNKDTKPWEKTLKEKLPDTTIEVFPNISNYEDITFVICWKPENKILEKFPNIQVIQSVGASVEHITNTQNISENVQITRICDYNLTNDMWEYLISSVMLQIRNFKLYAQQNELKIWKPVEYKSVKNTTISILGLGNIGAYVAEKFSHFGFVVKGWSASKKNIKNVTTYVGDDEFEDFLVNTDFLINILPLTSFTENILSAKTFEKLNMGAFVINVGRGEHLVEKDLIDFLSNGHLSGALLDVFREEPLPQTHPFWSNPKIQITPHIASITNVNTATDQIVTNYLAHTTGSTLQNIVSLKKGY